MNSAHTHLVLNHIPVLGMLFGILVIAYGFFRNSDEAKRIALVVFVGAALITIPVYMTGEPAEEIVEGLAGVSDSIIDLHEDAAIYAMIFMQITGGLALLNLVFFGRPFAKKFLVVVSLSSIIAAGLILWTANLGGKIRHTEIRSNFSQSTSPEKHTESADDDEH